MHKQWQAVEEESSKLTDLINTGTDKDLVRALDSMLPDQLRSAVTHIAKTGNTVFHLAAARERLNSVKAMLRNNVDVNARDGSGNSALYNCLCHNSMSSARLLINHGADVNELVSRVHRESLLHRMIKGDRAQAVDLLLDAGAALEATTNDGDTALHFSARYNRPAMARLLVDVGAELNAVNTRQETPMHVAIKNRSMDVAKVLVKNRASVTAKDRHGMTALHAAVAASAVELVRLMLINNSTQVNSKETLLGRTPLLLACSNSNQKMATLLLSHGADANLTTNYRKSVLHVAACSGNANVLGAVLKHATNRNALALNNKTPLHCAVIEGHSDIVKALLKSGVNVNMRDIDGNTALHMASQIGHNIILKDLLQYHAQVNATNMEQQTPLHVAFMMGHEETGWILIEAGSDPEMLDIHESTAQDYLAEFHRKAEEDVENQDALLGATGNVRFSDSRREFLHDIVEENFEEDGEYSSDPIERLNYVNGDCEHEKEARQKNNDKDSSNNDTPGSDSKVLGQVLSELILTNGDLESNDEKDEDDDEDAVVADADVKDSEQSCENSGEEGEGDEAAPQEGADGGHRKRSRHRRRSSKSKSSSSKSSPVRKHSKSKVKHKTSKGDDGGQACKQSGEHGATVQHGVTQTTEVKCQRRRKIGLATMK